jgi:hypothetical protein
MAAVHRGWETGGGQRCGDGGGMDRNQDERRRGQRWRHHSRRSTLDAAVVREETRRHGGMGRRSR